MRLLFKVLLVLGIFTTAAPAFAQDQEIVVTGSRIRGNGYYDSSAPAPSMALRRTADFAVQTVTVTGDTRDPDKRREEIYALIKGAIDLAGKYGVQLATGDVVVEQLTLANYRNLPLAKDDDREDTESTSFLIKVPLTPGTDAKAALDRFAKFIAAVPSVGRAEIKASEDLSLSVVNPEQYREPIIGLIAASANAAAAKFGPGYGVTVEGLQGRVQWSRASLTEVYLYLPASFTVVPKD
ncbi:TonB-dependent receptor [Sphingomonas sp. LB-2]|uniref:TonB-dependent receptor n=1 Tax=Sphingomonas caeni TaxID=2984949 RepID=UPI00222FA768|nr:TonB-dependent receptor [Sphingomonas caeni]MCW3847774.1 TonB-dependent receptor [Sphingomonas caeni]